MIERLSPEQIFSLIRAREERTPVERGFDFGLLVPIAFFAATLVALWLAKQFALRREHLRHETLRLLVERGQAIPPELLLPPTPSPFRRGIIFLSGGIGLLPLLLFGPLSRNHGAWAWAFVPICAGVGYLIVWRWGGSR